METSHKLQMGLSSPIMCPQFPIIFLYKSYGCDYFGLPRWLSGKGSTDKESDTTEQLSMHVIIFVIGMLITIVQNYITIRAEVFPHIPLSLSSHIPLSLSSLYSLCFSKDYLKKLSRYLLFFYVK